jgi:Putative auto-transporter adhesin, head GIN domain
MRSAAKKPKLAAVVVAVLILSIAISACGVSVAEDGKHEVRSRDVAPFSRIEVRGSTEVTVEHGRHAALRLVGGTDRVDDLRTWVEGGTLVVEQEDTSGTIDIGGDRARVVARVPAVEAVRIGGSGKVVLRDLHGPRLATTIQGSGEVRAGGQVERLRSRIDGSGTLRPAALRAGNAAVAISGSGSADLRSTERLHAEIDGSANVTYAGEPAITEDISGSGRIERR